MIDGYTLDFEPITYANGEVDRWTDPEDVRPDNAYVLRQYGRFVKVITWPLMDAYSLLHHDGIHIHNGAPSGWPMDSSAPELFGWRAWEEYAASLTPTQDEILV